MATVIDSAPVNITVPRNDCVDVVILAHNDDAKAAVLGAMDVQVGDKTVHVEATLPGTNATPVTFGEPVLSADLVAAGVHVINNGNGHYLVCGPDFDVATHSHG